MVGKLSSTISSKGQTTVPKEVRYMLDLTDGDKILYTPQENGFLITKVKEGYITCPHCNGTGRCKLKKESDSS